MPHFNTTKAQEYPSSIGNINLILTNLVQKNGLLLHEQRKWGRIYLTTQLQFCNILHQRLTLP